MPDHVGIRQIRQLIVTVRPDTIVTFGPDGLTGHPDHRAVSRWTTAAWQTTGRTTRLWYAAVTPELYQAWDDLDARHGVWMDHTRPPCATDEELSLTVTCTDRLLDRKLVALRAHASHTRRLERTDDLPACARPKPSSTRTVRPRQTLSDGGVREP